MVTQALRQNAAMNSLEGIRVLDLSRVLAGPWCTQTLADLGADVIKIERPGAGDDTRNWGPPFLPTADGRESHESAYYLGANRNKRSVTCDISQAAGQRLIRELVAHCQVFIENFKVGDMARYGLDYDSLRAINPKLVYCSLTGFGQTGPYRERAGYDYAIQGMGGLMSITGEAEQAPQKVGVAVVDLMTAMYATTAILAAVNHRHVTGQGQHIDLALFDVQAAMLANQAATYLLSGQIPTRQGSAHQSIAPYQPMRVQDGFVMLAVGNDGQFAQLCHAAGLPELAQDERFATNAQRTRNRKDLESALELAMLQKTIDEWVALGEQNGFPCGPINSIDRVFADPQIRARDMVVRTSEGYDLVANPIRFSATPITEYQSPAKLQKSN